VILAENDESNHSNEVSSNSKSSTVLEPIRQPSRDETSNSRNDEDWDDLSLDLRHGVCWVEGSDERWCENGNGIGG
jgi:hypothetical protein